MIGHSGLECLTLEGFEAGGFGVASLIHDPFDDSRAKTYC
jgi:hypothetical protein